MTPDTIHSLLAEYRAIFAEANIAVLERLLADAPAAPVAPGDEEIVEAMAKAIQSWNTAEIRWTGANDLYHNQWRDKARRALAAARPLLARQSTRRTDEEVEREIERVEQKPHPAYGVDPYDVGYTTALRWTLNKP